MSNLLETGEFQQIAFFDPYEGHIRNPGMGIVCMALSDHMVTGYTKEERQKNDLEPPFTWTSAMLEEACQSGLVDNVYIRIGWQDVQQEQGRLDLKEEFIQALSIIRKYQLSWGLRIMSSSPSNPEEHLLPEFVRRQVPMIPIIAKDFYGPQPKFIPSYTEAYLCLWNELTILLAKEFDDDPLLEYVDISGYGLWGEGHHGVPFSDPAQNPDLLPFDERNQIVSRIVQQYRQSFKKTPLVANLVWVQFSAIQQAVAEGIWVRRDAYYQWLQPNEAALGLMRDGGAAMIYETVMPGILIEDSDDPHFRRNFLNEPDKMCDYGANYGVIGFNPRDFTFAAHVYPQLFTAFKERLGYRLRPSIIWKKVKDDHSSLILGIVNDGTTAPPGEVTFCVLTKNDQSKMTISGDRFFGKMQLIELPLPNDAEREVTLTASLDYGKGPKEISFAVAGKEQAPQELTLLLSH